MFNITTTIKNTIMRTFFFTLFFFCCGVIGFAQTVPTVKAVDQTKNDQPSCNNSLRNVQERKATIPNTTASYRPSISIISIIPTLKLWLLPANFPNPFTKVED